MTTWNNGTRVRPVVLNCRNCQLLGSIPAHCDTLSHTGSVGVSSRPLKTLKLVPHSAVGKQSLGLKVVLIVSMDKGASTFVIVPSL
jgi:hypothetical protein